MAATYLINITAMASPSGVEPGTSRSGVPVPGNRADQLNRRQGEILYDCYAKSYGAPVLVNNNPKIWSPAKLKWLAAEKLRREHFVAEFSDLGGLKSFGPGGRFNAAVLKAVAEQPFFGFLARINAWLRSNPRGPYPALPELPRRGNEWSLNEVVRNHPYYVVSPDRSGNGDSGPGNEDPGNPAGEDSDSDIPPVK